MSLKVHWPGIVASMALLAGGLAAALWWVAHEPPAGLLRVKPRDFVRPDGVPVPAERLPSAEKIALGERLFSDIRLSSNGQVACATCHNPALAFTDGVARGKGVPGLALPRNTPHLWNLAWGENFFWDGRAASLEDQARVPLENPNEMNMKLEDATRVLNADPAMREGFRSAFGSPQVAGKDILAALAAYERTLVSPKTRFDRWLEGDHAALSAQELLGYRVFTGKGGAKGGCSNCHNTWRFTDDAFHDVGLPETADKGRGAVTGLKAANNAFKTPSLRELAWTAPYMHDGSLPTLEDVIAHYEGGIHVRATLSKDLPPPPQFSDEERAALMAFLHTLSSEEPPKPAAAKPVVQAPLTADLNAVRTSKISQKDKQFAPASVRIAKGEALTIVNDDSRTHSVRIDDSRLKFASNAQEPGDSVVLTFPEAGVYGVICSIHPKMKLSVTVTDTNAAAGVNDKSTRESAPQP